MTISSILSGIAAAATVFAIGFLFGLDIGRIAGYRRGRRTERHKAIQAGVAKYSKAENKTIFEYKDNK